MGVRPFVEQGAVESFYLAVGLRSTWSYPPMIDPGNRLLKRSADRVVAGIVGEDGIDDDAIVGEEALDTVPELSACCAAFVVQHLAVGQAAVRVDRGVDVVVADAVMFHVAAAVCSPAAAGWDPSELLDVDVGELAGRCGCGGSPGPSAGPSKRCD
jgi:hypothetical protein